MASSYQRLTSAFWGALLLAHMLNFFTSFKSTLLQETSKKPINCPDYLSSHKQGCCLYEDLWFKCTLKLYRSTFAVIKAALSLYRPDSSDMPGYRAKTTQSVVLCTYRGSFFCLGKYKYKIRGSFRFHDCHTPTESSECSRLAPW